MRRYREGKDITNRLHVLTNGQPEPLTGRNLTVHLIDPSGCAMVMPFTIIDVNVLEFVFWGIDQKALGTYKLTLWENFGRHGQTVVDVKDAFRLVPDTSMEGGEDPEGLDTEVNDLDMDLSTGVRGADGVGVENIVYNSDYTMTIYLTDGTSYTSPVLRGEKGETGPQGPQGATGATGARGDTGATGTGIASVVQTAISTADGGTNVVTVTLTDGTKSTFQVKNGTKGSKGDKGDTGPQGPQGATGATGATGPAGADWVPTSAELQSIAEAAAEIVSSDIETLLAAI